MSIFKRGRMYWYHFVFNGEHIQESTKQCNPRVARQIEAAHRTSLAKGEVGIRERLPVPELSGFLENDFLPFISAQFKAKPKTAQYYEYGTALFRHSDLWNLKLDDIRSQHAGGFITRNSGLSPSTVNCGLRTLRRALNLAEDWGKLTRAPKITESGSGRGCLVTRRSWRTSSCASNRGLMWQPCFMGLAFVQAKHIR